MTRRPEALDSLRFVEVDEFPPLADITHGQLFALSLSGTTTAFTHGLHRFAAKFIPQVPAWALDTFGSRRSVVVDPFMGSGTTLVEGLLRGGTTIGVDVDPLARFIARAKVTPVDDDRLRELSTEVAARWRAPATTLQPPMPDIANFGHWFGAGSFDSVIFSPPYVNRFDYVESQKVELWFGGFVDGYDAMLALRKRSLRSHLGAALERPVLSLPEVEDLIARMDPASYALRSRVPALLRGYFSDMADILRHCRRVLDAGGRCFVVVGNSAYGGVIIPTDALIARLGFAAGFGAAAVVPVRHLTVAPQQRNELRGREGLMRESIVVLS